MSIEQDKNEIEKIKVTIAKEIRSIGNSFEKAGEDRDVAESIIKLIVSLAEKKALLRASIAFKVSCNNRMAGFCNLGRDRCENLRCERVKMFLKMIQEVDSE